MLGVLHQDYCEVTWYNTEELAETCRVCYTFEFSFGDPLPLPKFSQRFLFAFMTP